MKFKGGGIHISLSRSIDLAKLNPNCHMNCSIIFTEISFYPETSSLQVVWIWGELLPRLQGSGDKSTRLQSVLPV